MKAIKSLKNSYNSSLREANDALTNISSMSLKEYRYWIAQRKKYKRKLELLQNF